MPQSNESMSTSAAAILAHLKTVDDERARRAELPGLDSKIVALKAYQQRRFSHTYADLLKTERYSAASRFFLDELYGPTDFTRRDSQFARVVPTLVRLFPSEVIDTVAALVALHALSESLDTAMSTHFTTGPVASIDYIRAWQRTGRGGDRATQVALTLDLVERLDQLTSRIFLRNSLRLMRRPAQAAGLGELQQFLETGFETFRKMKGAHDFITIVDERESKLAAALFSANTETFENLATIDAMARLPPFP